MSAISFSVIGKHNEPLYIKEFFDEDRPGNRLNENFPEEELFGLNLSTSRQTNCSIRQQFILHAALDKFDELSGPPPGCAWRAQGVAGADAMFVGLLCPMEDLRVYGKRFFLSAFHCP
jgi:Sedlin, N-terminal conserved region